jgi:hypothetical protein
MKKIHVASEGTQTEYSESDLLLLWRQGKILKDAKYWKEGMTDWQPLAGYFPPENAPFNPYASPSDIPLEPVSRSGYFYTTPPHTLTRLLLVMLWVCLIAEFVKIGSEVAQLLLLQSPFTKEAAEANNLRQTVVSYSWLTIYFGTSIPFLRWIYRANVNCRGFGARDMKVTPGWSIGSFFLPFLNLVRPYEAMKEIWKVSQDPMNWQSQSVSPIVGWWWGLWILSNVMGRVSMSFGQRADTVDSLITSTGVAIAASGVTIPLTILVILLVRKISRKQDELVNESAELPIRTF